MEGFNATVDVYGARREINLMLLPEDVVIGDYVLVHAGFAIQIVDRESARESLTLIGTLFPEGERPS
jgi:hydrogenase expression/formation protein HypC